MENEWEKTDYSDDEFSDDEDMVWGEESDEI